MTRSAAAWGVYAGYVDDRGRSVRVPPEAIEAVLDIMEADAEEPPDGGPLVTSPPRPVRLPRGSEVITEHGDRIRVGLRRPRVPFGYHRVRLPGEEERLLISSPGRCRLPTADRVWGWALQVYALRSRTSWGIGDLGDLARFGRWASSAGAGVALLNPLHAPTPSPAPQPSPYFPSSRCFRDPLYLRVEEVPGAEACGPRLADLAGRARRLDADRRIDRAAVQALKLEALDLVWRAVRDRERGDPSAPERDALERFATFQALAQDNPGPWTRWAPELRDPRSGAVARFRAGNSDRVAFHAWLQRMLDGQIARAADEIDLIHDLAIGVDPAGADAWAWSDSFAHGARVGAPPDEFNTRGQDWGVLPFDPWKLRAADYGPFIETVRASLLHAAGMRFDHVMGLFRLFWIPPGFDPTSGAYVRYPEADLLDILALESVRAGAFVIGEDLGTVEPRVREEMRRRRMLSYRLLWFEPGGVEDLPRDALAAVGSHDLPTVAGLWTGSDLEVQKALGLEPNEDGVRALRARIADRFGLPDDARPSAVAEALYRALAGAPSRILIAQLEDALGVEERTNHPGSVAATNWSLALPAFLDEVVRHPGVVEIASILASEGRSRR